MLKERRIVLGVTGGIAAYKAAELVRELVRRGAKVRVVMTDHACRVRHAADLRDPVRQSGRHGPVPVDREF